MGNERDKALAIRTNVMLWQNLQKDMRKTQRCSSPYW